MSNMVKIDLNKWQTQAQAAREYIKKDGTKGVTVPRINKLMKDGKLKTNDLSKELGIVLVEKKVSK